MQKVKVSISFTFQVKFLSIVMDLFFKHGYLALLFDRDNSTTSIATLIDANTYYFYEKKRENVDYILIIFLFINVLKFKVLNYIMRRPQKFEENLPLSLDVSK
jgi:hypothetical protein